MQSETSICALEEYPKAKSLLKKAICHALYQKGLITKEQLYQLIKLLPQESLSLV